ncbi:MAG: ArnT family glycosyltransferase [Leadbetterella sp.]
MLNSPENKSFSIIAWGAIALFFVLGCLYIAFPGLQTDEILYANVALGEINNRTYVARKLFGVTFFLINYIGALKAWLYYPIFKIFGFNVYSIRIPMILLTCFSLWYIYKSQLISTKNSFLALCVVLILCVEPTLIAMVRTDVGPIAIEYFLKSIAIWILFLYVKEQKIKYYLFLIVILSLGVFNKLNFMWFCNALVGASVALIYFIPRASRWKFMIYMGILFVFEWGVFFVISKLNPGVIDAKMNIDWTYIQNRIQLFYYFCKGIMDGTGFYRIQYFLEADTLGNNGFQVGISKMGFYLFEISLLFIVIYTGICIKNLVKRNFSDLNLYFLFYLLIVLGIGAQVFLVKNATNLWHYYSMFPFYTFCVIYAVFGIFLSYKPSISYLFMGFWLLFNVSNYSSYIGAFSSKTPNPNWSNSIGDLANYVKPLKGEFVLLDWGMNTQLLCLTKQDKYVDGFLTKKFEILYQQPNAADVFYDDHVQGKSLENLYFVSVTSRFSEPKFKEVFENMIKNKNFTKITVKNFNERDGSPIFAIYKLKLKP